MQHHNTKDLSDLPEWNTADPTVYRLLKDERKELKQNMTPAEAVLWEQLKGKKIGVKFRRQHMIDCFIPDFVSLPAKLIVEVDGGIHKKQIEYDNNRTFLLNERGFRVIRFTNEEVLQDIDNVVRRIRESL